MTNSGLNLKRVVGGIWYNGIRYTIETGRRPDLRFLLFQNYNFRGTAVFVLKDKDEDIRIFLPYDEYCAEGRISFLDFPYKLEGRVGLYVEDLGLFVCGGTDRKKYDSRKCWTLSKKTKYRWEELKHPLQRHRIRSSILLQDRKIFIIGGESSHSVSEFSYEVLDLDHLEDGWRLERLEIRDYGAEDLCCGLNTIYFKVPCTF